VSLPLVPADRPVWSAVGTGGSSCYLRAAPPLSSRTLNYAAGLIRHHRKSIGSCWRKLNPGPQAPLVLVYLRTGGTFSELAAGFGGGTTTAGRYPNETVELLAAERRSCGRRSGTR
jgi:Helix-turn-helix of DDE superfamily endonuclease